MNLVELMKDQLGAAITQKAAGMLGVSPDRARATTDAVIPTILAGLTHAASTPDGAARVNDAIDAGGHPSDGGGGGGGVTGMLESLLGGKTFSGLAAALAKTLGLSSDGITKLLGSIAGPVMGLLKHQKDSLGLDAGGMAHLLASQKQNIASALPSGLGQSLAGMAGLGSLGEWVRGAASGSMERGREALAGASDTVASGARSMAHAGAAAGHSAASWVLPVLAVCALGLGAGLWWRSAHSGQPSPGPNTGAARMNSNADDAARMASETMHGAADTVAATASKATDQLTDVVKSAGDTLGQIKDAASADAAIPKLKALGDKLDGLKKVAAALPADARSKFGPMIADARTSLETAAQKVMAIPGVGEKIKPVIDELMKKLSDVTQ